ncbi:cation:proton antiporter [Nonomuraea sp. NPDC059023]|uniref:cation:proton antiporter domain-containing protein n=1 Tax=unclassified Nonomuraea TaxID=2593643 RepID=UPI0036BA61FD
MISSIIAVGATLVVWSLMARKFEQWRLTAPVVAVVAGALVGLTVRDSIGETLNTHAALRAAEIILAVLLFIDAADVRDGMLGRSPGAALRVLLIALPLSLALTVAVGWWLLPEVAWPVLLVIACVVMPTDYAPAQAILRDPRLPARVKDVLNVEGGYNDGVVSPIILFALVLAGDGTKTQTPGDALGSAWPSAAKAILVGLALGALLGFLVSRAGRAGFMSTQSKRLVVVAAPLLTYGTAVAIGGNGFVASFVCGFVFHAVRQNEETRREMELIDDIGFLLGVVMWFVFGTAALFALWGGVDWRLLVFCVAALTVLRIAPVMLSLIGSGVPAKEGLLIGSLGPRGTTSIVFGLLAFNELHDDVSIPVLTALVITVLGSVVLHGLGSPVAARRYRL